MSDFFVEQNDLTAAKVRVYEEYITGYLPKILQTFKRCLIADLFCGAGKNGNQDGSPLVLIKQVQYILTNPVLKQKDLEVDILFNDKIKEYTDDLELQLNNISHSYINIHPITNKDFQNSLTNILHKFKNSNTPKFFFLDPFKYSDVTIDNLRDLMALPYTEVFLFTPVFHGYRFSNKNDYAKEHKTRKFVEEFTTRGMSNYDGIDDFMQSIKNKIKSELNLDYVRPVLLDGGKCKNAIFLLTKHREGMLLMNKIALKKSDDGKGVNIKVQQSGQVDIFGTQGTSRFDMFSKDLEKELKNKKIMTNAEIVDFSIIEEFLPSHAKDVLNTLCINNKITVLNGSDNITNKKTQWNIAEKITKNITFTYDN
ncbi:MAG: three-Cys-motif partner protein TcmP [Gammaproteobacteria bacterium]|nr:three-Cys-motif partner protein TcmP [Gammaproteobacteria bacterium]